MINGVHEAKLHLVTKQESLRFERNPRLCHQQLD